MIVRELTTVLGFKIEEDKLRRLDAIVNLTIRSVTRLSRKLEDIGRTAQRIGGGMTAFITAPLTIMGGMMIKTAADAEETRNRFNVVFRDIQKDASETATSLAKDFELSEATAVELLARTGDLLVGWDFAQDKALDLSNQVNRLAADLASFQDIQGGAQEAGMRLTKGILGETENLKLLGIGVNQGSEEFRAQVKAIMAAERVTQRQAKVLTILRIAQHQSRLAVGDFRRTIESFNNQLRIARERIKDIAISFGKILLPLATIILRTFNKVLKVFNMLPTPIKKVIVGFSSLVAIIGPVIFILATLLIHLGMTTLQFIVIRKVLAYFGWTIWGVFSKVGKIIFRLSKYFSLLRYAIIWLIKFFGILLLKILALIAILVALSYIIHLIYDDIRVWTEGGDSLIGMLLGSFKRFKEHVRRIWDVLKKMFFTFWLAVNTGSRKQWDKFKALFGELVGIVASLFVKLIKNIDEFLGIADKTFESWEEHLAAWIIRFSIKLVVLVMRIITNLLIFIWQDIFNMLDEKLGHLHKRLYDWLHKKMPGFAEWLVTPIIKGGEGEKPGVGKAFSPMPGAYIPSYLAAAGAGGPNVRIDSTVHVTVPEGTRREQADYLKGVARTEWSNEFKKHLNKAIISMQPSEKK